MTEWPNHLPCHASVGPVGPLFQLNCRVIVCWVPKLPFSCNRLNELFAPKNHFHFPLISLVFCSSLFLFSIVDRLVICPAVRVCFNP